MDKLTENSSPARRRQAVDRACHELALPEPRVCKVLGQPRSTQRHLPQLADAAARAMVHEGSVAAVLPTLENIDAEAWRQATAVVDSPRTGLGVRRPWHVVYMSCDPATMARDAAVLVAGGYRLRELRVLEMFPQTAHVDCLGLLEYDQGGDV